MNKKKYNRTTFNSFFNHLWPDEDKSVWNLMPPVNELEENPQLFFNSPIEFQNMMYKRKDDNILVPKLVTIAGNKLFYSKSKISGKEPDCYLELDWTFGEIETYPNFQNSGHTYYQVMFHRGRKYTEIGTFDPGVFSFFRPLIRKKCILNSFNIDYEVIKLISEGVLAKVYEIRGKASSRAFSVKIINKQIFKVDKKTRDKIVSEIKVLRAVSGCNKHLIQFEEIHETSRNLYIVMELIRGPSLLLIHSLGLLPTETELKMVLKQTLTGMKHMHDKNIVHRDIKPESLILINFGKASEQNFVKLVGYSDCVFHTNSNMEAMRVDDIKCGTIGFTAPEVLNIKLNDKTIQNHPKRDIFSLGAVIYYLATKRYVFNVEQPEDLIKANVKGEVDLAYRYFDRLSQPCKNFKTPQI